MKQMFKISIKEEFLDECLGYVVAHTKFCKTEPGNLTSEVFRSVAEPNCVYLLTEWDTPEHEKAHIESEADHAFIARMSGKEAAPVQHIEWEQLA